jgi:TolB-like protein
LLLNAAQKNTLITPPLTPPITTAIKAESSAIKSIAILPFKQLTPHKDEEYLGVGIADTLINRLSNQRKVQVRPLNAALADKDSDALAAGRAQKVDAVLEGTVQHVGNQLRVNARLLRIGDGISLWTENYDFTWQDYFATQDAIAKQIVKALALQLSAQEQATIAKPLTRNAEALQLYLKGRYLYNRVDFEQIEVMLNLFQQAVAKDPEFARAYEGIAASYVSMGHKGNTNPKEAWTQARAAALKALEIDPQLATAYAILSAVELNNLKAEQLCLRALELDPNSYEVREAYSIALWSQGKFQAAQVENQRILELNPLSLHAYFNEAVVYFYAGKFEQTIESARRVSAIEPNNPVPHMISGDALTQLGRYQEAIAEYKLGGAGENDDQIAAALALSGHREEALQILNNLKAIAQRRYVSSFSLARVCIALGDQEQALAWLQKADEEQAGEMRYIKVDPRFVSLHSDPRFQEILRHRNLHD